MALDPSRSSGTSGEESGEESGKKSEGKKIKPPPESLADIRLSFSSIDKYRQCPKKWYKKYVLRQPEPTGPDALMGGYVHELLETVMAAPYEDRTLGLARELASDGWDEFFVEFVETLKVDRPDLEIDEEESKFDCWKRLRGLWDVEDPREIEVAGIEETISTQIEGQDFIGYVDRVDNVDGDIIITDYKTGKIPQPAYTESKIAQILLYGVGYEIQFGITPKYGKLLYLQDGIIEVQFNETNFMETKKFFKRTAQAMDKAFLVGEEGFKAKKGPLCCWCPYLAECEEGQAEFYDRHAWNKVRPDAPAYKIMGVEPKQRGWR